MTPSENPWIEDPNWPVSDWKYEVANDDTRLGYLDWIQHQQESNDVSDRQSPTKP